MNIWWIKYLKRTILLIKNYIRCNFSGANKNEFMKLRSNLAILKTFCEQFKYEKHFFKALGKYLIWQNLESCVEDRVRTGAVINLSIKDPLEFFEKARKPFDLKVKYEFRQFLLKVNVVFLVKFMKHQSGEMDIKHFQT